MVGELSSKAYLELMGPITVLPGTAFGLKQATLVVRLAARIPPTTDFVALDAAMQSLLAADQVAPTTGDVLADLIARLACWYQQIHRGLRIPLFPESWWQRQTLPELPHELAAVLALPYVQPDPEKKAIATLVSLTNRILDTGEMPTGAREQISAVRTLLSSALAGGINGHHFLKAAFELDIPVIHNRLSDTVRFGMGSKSRLLKSSCTDVTPHIGVAIAKTKIGTAELLARSGLPVPPRWLVGDAQGARTAAEALGYPVVVKPDGRDRGEGVAAHLTNAVDLDQAYRVARSLSERVLVEKHVFGEDLRFTVFNGRVVKLMARRPPGVTGDGIRSIAHLVEAERNSAETARRSVDRQFRPLEIDEEASGLLRDAGLTADTVLAADRFIALRRRGNVCSGGSQRILDVRDVHPDNLELAVRAARCLLLDLAGVDIMLPDPSRSWLEGEAFILEVNAIPQIGSEGSPEMYRDILGALLPDGGRVPMHVLLVSDGTPSEEFVLSTAASRGCNGVATSTALWVNGRRLGVTFQNAFVAALAVLSEPEVHAALIVMSPADVIRFGVPCGRPTGVIEACGEHAALPPDEVRVAKQMLGEG